MTIHTHRLPKRKQCVLKREKAEREYGEDESDVIGYHRDESLERVINEIKEKHESARDGNGITLQVLVKRGEEVRERERERSDEERERAESRGEKREELVGPVLHTQKRVSHKQLQRGKATENVLETGGERGEKARKKGGDGPKECRERRGERREEGRK